MRHGVIAVAIISTLVGSIAHDSRGDIAYGVGKYMNFDGFSGVFSLDTTTSAVNMLIHTPGVRWYGATDGPTVDKFYAVANPWYDPNPNPALKADPRSELFEIDTTSWTVNFIGYITVPGGNPIREIAWDEDTNTLFGTDYSYLYSIPTSGGATTNVGPFNTTGDPLDYVLALDYDKNLDRLVGTSWIDGEALPDKSDLYSISTANGEASRIGYTGIALVTDVWYSDNSGKLLAVSDKPGQVLDINVATGNAVEIGPLSNLTATGMANAIAGSSAPVAFVTAPAPITALDYTSSASVHVEAHISNAAGAKQDTILPTQSDSGVNADAVVNPFGAIATIPSSTPEQRTHGIAETYITGPTANNGIAPGVLRVTAHATGTAWGSDEGQSGITRYSDLTGITAMQGELIVGVPAGGTIGDSVLFGASVFMEGWIDNEHVLFVPGVHTPGGMQPAWTLSITELSENTYLTATSVTSDPWDFSFIVAAGQTLNYEFGFTGVMLGVQNGDYEFYADVDFGAAATVPEPATLMLLGSGAVLVLLKRRRRRS
jgi:hypothetical protein